jgi:hypothetical protein
MTTEGIVSRGGDPPSRTSLQYEDDALEFGEIGQRVPPTATRSAYLPGSTGKPM